MNLSLVLINQLSVLLLVLLLVALVGVGLAVMMVRWHHWGQPLLHRLLLLPLAIPAYLLLYLLQDGQVAGTGVATPWTDPWWRLVGVYTVTLYPLVYLPAVQVLRRGNRALEEAGLFLGLSQAQRDRVLLPPKIRLALILGLSLATLLMLSDYATPTIAAVPTLATLLVAESLRGEPLWGQLSLLLLLFGEGVLFWGMWRLMLGRVPIRRLCASPLPPPQQRFWGVTVALFGVWLGGVMAVGVGLFSLVEESDRVVARWSESLPLVERTAGLILLGLLLLGLWLLSSLYYRQPRGGVTEMMEPIPPVFAVPPLLLAVVLAAALEPVKRLVESRWPLAALEFHAISGLVLLVGGYLLLYGALVRRTLDSHLNRINPITPPMAAAVLGLPLRQVVWRLDLPLVVAPLLLIALLFALILAREVTLSLLLLPPQWPTLATGLFRAVVAGEREAIFWPLLWQIGLSLAMVPLLHYSGHYALQLSEEKERHEPTA